MAEFIWKAQVRGGEERTGVMEAEDVDTVTARLKALKYQKIRVKKKSKEIKLSIGTGVGAKDLVIFTRQFATMIAAGLPLIQCLDILSSQGDNPALNSILKDIKQGVEKGTTLSE